MAGCYALEADELPRRWLPREIFADIGIADPDPVVVPGDADDAPPDVTMEELAAQLADLLGAQKRAAPTPPPPPAANFPGPFHCSPVRGMEGPPVFPTYGGGRIKAGAGGAAPYSPVQWQVPINTRSTMLPPAPFANVVGAHADYLMFPPPRNGTGVFLPRIGVYRHAQAPRVVRPAPPLNPTGPWPVRPPPQLNGAVRPPQRPIGTKQQWKKAAADSPAAALPKEWSYA